MDNKILFSIVVPIYNVEDYLERCVNSLIEQTYNNIEIILVDDGSPDKCPLLCDQYKLNDSRIKVIHKINGGLSDARNVGIQHATGEYIIFVDSDDYIEKKSCELLVDYASKNVDIIISEAVVEGGKANLEHISLSHVVSGKKYLELALREKKCPMAVWLNVYRRKFLIDNNLSFKKGIYHEDEEFTPRAFLSANSVISSDVVLYHYILRDNSITTTKDKRKNIMDLYSTAYELEKIYVKIEEKQLRNMLLDTLAEKILSVFQSGELYKYGRHYLNIVFLINNSKRIRSKIKTFLVYLSPTLYFRINNFEKRIRL